jgi:hypothetical protein
MEADIPEERTPGRRHGRLRRTRGREVSPH